MGQGGRRCEGGSSGQIRDKMIGCWLRWNQELRWPLEVAKSKGRDFSMEPAEGPQPSISILHALGEYLIWIHSALEVLGILKYFEELEFGWALGFYPSLLYQLDFKTELMFHWFGKCTQEKVLSGLSFFFFFFF